MTAIKGLLSVASPVLFKLIEGEFPTSRKECEFMINVAILVAKSNGYISEGENKKLTKLVKRQILLSKEKKEEYLNKIKVGEYDVMQFSELRSLQRSIEDLDIKLSVYRRVVKYIYSCNDDVPVEKEAVKILLGSFFKQESQSVYIVNPHPSKNAIDEIKYLSKERLLKKFPETKYIPNVNIYLQHPFGREKELVTKKHFLMLNENYLEEEITQANRIFLELGARKIRVIKTSNSIKKFNLTSTLPGAAINVEAKTTNRKIRNDEVSGVYEGKEPNLEKAMRELGRFSWSQMYVDLQRLVDSFISGNKAKSFVVTKSDTSVLGASLFISKRINILANPRARKKDSLKIIVTFDDSNN
ncbi:hypothetical protein RI065_06465 [Mycoplasmatota bacterium zrk1]